jgi:hypothetical protein
MALLGSLANQASAEPIKIALPVLSLEPMPIFIVATSSAVPPTIH